jgi:hypothetical protein
LYNGCRHVEENATMAKKLTREEVRTIRYLYGTGYSQGRLARHYEVSVNTIGKITRGESWQERTLELPPPLPPRGSETRLDLRSEVEGTIRASEARVQGLLERQKPRRETFEEAALRIKNMPLEEDADAGYGVPLAPEEVDEAAAAFLKRLLPGDEPTGGDGGQ